MPAEKERPGDGVTHPVIDTPLQGPAHTLDADKVLTAFEVDLDNGLTDDQAAKAMNRYGPNKLKEQPPPSFWSILVRNALNAMTIVLIAAMAVSFGTQDWISGGVIAALVVSKRCIWRKFVFAHLERSGDAHGGETSRSRQE